MTKHDTFLAHDQRQGPSLERLNAVRMMVVAMIAVGYASTMAIGPGNSEALRHFGYDPSWYGVQVLFFISGFLGMRSLERHNTFKTYLVSRAARNLPILIVYTLATITVLYPIFCQYSGNMPAEILKLSRYFIETVTLIDPGQRLPGLLDDARYMCLIQGAIWTLRWGAFAHFCLALGWHLKILQNRQTLLFLTLITIVGYVIIVFYTVTTQIFTYESIIAGLRVGYAFLIGATIFAWKDKLPKKLVANLGILSILFIATFIHFTYIPWSPMIEVLMSSFWCYLTLTIILTPLRVTNWLKHWPNLTASLYMCHWPVTQILLLKHPELSGTSLIISALLSSVFVAGMTYFALNGHINRFVERLFTPRQKLS